MIVCYHALEKTPVQVFIYTLNYTVKESKT